MPLPIFCGLTSVPSSFLVALAHPENFMKIMKEILKFLKKSKKKSEKKIEKKTLKFSDFWFYLIGRLDVRLIV